MLYYRGLHGTAIHFKPIRRIQFDDSLFLMLKWYNFAPMKTGRTIKKYSWNIIVASDECMRKMDGTGLSIWMAEYRCAEKYQSMWTPGAYSNHSAETLLLKRDDRAYYLKRKIRPSWEQMNARIIYPLPAGANKRLPTTWHMLDGKRAALYKNN